MAEEEKKVSETESNYLEEALKANQTLKEELQKSREEMQKMAEDNKTIIKKLLEGGENPQEETDSRDIPTIIKDMRSDSISDVEYAKNALVYRKKCMEQGYGDPFVGKGHDYVPDDRESEKAENLANCLQHCIDYSEGDNQVFLNELSRITVDIPGGKLLNRR